MSTYGYEPLSRTLSVMWPTGRAHRAQVLTVLPPGTPAEGVDRLAEALDQLSRALWDTYVNPAAQFGDPSVRGTEAWRWGLEREAFPTALAAVRDPQLPRNGEVFVSYCRVEEGGNQVGRALHELHLGPDLAAEVAAEVVREQAAVEAAEAGDLSGRAAQAVMLSRVGASPTQIEVAWQALLHDPLNAHDQLLTDFEPCAAAIAAARALRCAAEIAADVTGGDAVEVLRDADAMQPMPLLTPVTVLEMVADGATEHEVVAHLLHRAQAVAIGQLSGPQHLVDLNEQARAAGEMDADRAPEIRLTVLDPRRPGPDLLEDLLSAIEGCLLVWQEYMGEDLDDADDACLCGCDSGRGPVHAAGHGGAASAPARDEVGGPGRGAAVAVGLDPDLALHRARVRQAVLVDRFCRDLRAAMNAIGSPAWGA